MGNEERIIDKIILDAENEKKKILEQAQKEADHIIHIAQEQAEKELNSARALATAEAEKATAKVFSGAKMEAKKMILSQKQKCLEDTMEQIKQKLFSQSPVEYEKTIISMLEKAEQGEEIILSEKDINLLKKTLEEKGYIVSDETRDISGGFIVKKGEIEYNYSFEAIFAVEKEQIEQIIAEILFQ